MRRTDVIMRPMAALQTPGSYIRRMYAIVHPTVTVLCPVDAISNAGTCWENAYFYHYKGSNRI